MKTIGVLGGMSWESSAEWYRLANERVRELRGGHHSARILLDSLDFAEVEALQSRDDWDAAGALLADRAAALETAGAELLVLVLATNTMHLVADRMQAAVNIPSCTSQIRQARRSPPPDCGRSGFWGRRSRWSVRSTPTDSPRTVSAR